MAAKAEETPALGITSRQLFRNAIVLTMMVGSSRYIRLVVEASSGGHGTRQQKKYAVREASYRVKS
jgi:hypothetical protein